LEEYLSEYKGCLIVVSHDRYFLDNIVDHLFVMQGQGVVKDFPGNYSEYREWTDEENRRQAAEARVDVKPEPNVNRHQQRPPKMSFKEKQEFEALSVEIEQLTAEKKALDDLFNSGEMIDDIAAKSARYNQLQELLDEKEMRWLELSEKS
jgi:ATP-binding cassette subfamily F protein uup